MKQKFLLSLLAILSIAPLFAQKKSQPLVAYAITGVEKGNTRWAEVTLVDVGTGNAIRKIYESAAEVQRLNARTGKPILVKDDADKQMKEILIEPSQGNNSYKIISGNTIEPSPNSGAAKKVIVRLRKLNRDQPFATNSAACAYDKKHERLYYTPMGINQLRYIDLKAKTPTVYYFEDESFGVVAGPGDVSNQVTRMVLASNGKGYALTNNGDHLLEFTTKKNPVITDLGALNDDAANGRYSVHSSVGYGGDMVADEAGNLVLITANRRVFRINIETKLAAYLGSIKGLPDGFTSNGAVVEKGTNIIVSSSTSTAGYYQFDINELQASKYSEGDAVFNASDLANDHLLSAKKDKKKKEQPGIIVVDELSQPVEYSNGEYKLGSPEPATARLGVYPNPVTNGIVKISFSDYREGRYSLQLYDLTGKQLASRTITINSKNQVQELRLPAMLAKGSYLVKTTNEEGKIIHTEKLMVE